jgi:hypothetical protein
VDSINTIPMSKYFFFIVISCLLFVNCKTDKSASYPSKDLLKHGFAISVKAPDAAEIKFDDYGIMQELAISHGEDYNIQILKSISNTSNPKEALNDQMDLVKTDRYFSKILEEYESGFIFEKKIDKNINYDFRYVKLIGENEYIYQTGMVGTYSEESVREMYKSVQ